MVSQAIQKHCQQHGIEIIKLSSGATRYLGAGVDLTLAGGNAPKLENLKPYAARKGRNLRNV